MSQVWKIGLYERNQAKTEARCLACAFQPPKIIQTTDGSTKGVIKHTKIHPEYALKLQQLYQKDVAEKNSIDKFVRVLPKGELSSLDKKVLHFVSCTNQPLSIVDEPTFKSLFAANDREALKGRHHYTDSALPQMYGLVKKEVRKRLADCPVLSFTSDIWSGPTESFISLTAHGIHSMWKRVKYVLCIKHFPGSHNFGTIGDVINRMLEEWGIQRQKCHVFLRDEGSNMKKAFEEGGFLHADCGAHKLNLVARNSLFDDAKIKAVLEKCRNLVSHFHHSKLAKNRLEMEQKSANIKVHRLKQDVPTRWNTTFYMCERLCEQKCL